MVDDRATYCPGSPETQWFPEMWYFHSPNQKRLRQTGISWFALSDEQYALNVLIIDHNSVYLAVITLIWKVDWGLGKRTRGLFSFLATLECGRVL